MSRFKQVPAAGWVVVGVAVAVLLIPTTVGAVVALKFTGIEGTSTNKVDVAPSGQLLTTDAPPGSIFNYGGMASGGVRPVVAPSGKDAIVTQLSVMVDGLTASQTEEGWFFVTPSSACYVPGSHGIATGYWEEFIPVTGPGFQNQNFPTGIVVPSGDFLCGGLTSIIMSTSAWVTVSGYDVPTGSVQAPNGA